MPAPDPQPDESQDQYMDRCMRDNLTDDEEDRESECQLAWTDSQDTDPEEQPPEEGARRSRRYGTPQRSNRKMDIRQARQNASDLSREALEMRREGRRLLGTLDGNGRLSAQTEDAYQALLKRIDHNEESQIEANDYVGRWEEMGGGRDQQLRVPSRATGSDRPNQDGASPKPFRNLGEQLSAVAAVTRDPVGQARHPGRAGLDQIQAALGANEGVPSEGGFLVQTDFTTELLALVHETGTLAGRTDSKPIGPNSNGLKINAVDETSRADGSRWGSVQAFWENEAATLTATKPKYRQMELNLQKLTGLYHATTELLMDTTALGAFAQSAFAEEFGFKVDDAIIRGSGGGEPLGILAHSGTIDVAKETDQGALTINAQNIEKMWARMWARSLTGAEWYINQDTWPQLFQLSHVVGTGGVPMFILPGGIGAAPGGMLLGRPVIPIEQCETLGASGDIIFADLSQYLMIEKGGIDAATSIHVQFLTDEVTFRFILRTDGQPKRNAPLTPYKGTNTQSSFITLAARA